MRDLSWTVRTWRGTHLRHPRDMDDEALRLVLDGPAPSWASAQWLRACAREQARRAIRQ